MLFVTFAALGGAGCASQAQQQPAPARVPAAAARREALLSVERITALATRPREWIDYLERSRAQRASDSTSMAGELRAAGRTAMTQPAYARSFEIGESMNAAWFAADSARRIAESILSFQAPNGGWSKHVSYRDGPRAPGQNYFGESRQWQWISTFDNSSTTEQMRFLALRDSVQPDARYKAAWLRGMQYILAAQFPNGCWPQVWPLDGGYHDAATFNDDVLTNILTTLQRATDGNPAFVTGADRELARQALERGIACVLDAQVVVAGVRTVWGQQHDPLTLAPIGARSYEHASLSAQESANLLRFLVRQRNPSPKLKMAVHAAGAWLKARAIHGYKYDFQKGLEAAPGEGPVWARMYEIETNRPLFSDRNGVKLYDWNQLRDRRTGYAWYTYAPVLALRQYDNWARRNPPDGAE